MTLIRLPHSTSPRDVLPILEKLESAASQGDVLIDFCDVQHIEPLGTLLLLSGIRRLMGGSTGLKFAEQPRTDSQGHHLLGHMGFWEELGIEFDKKKGPPTADTIPIQTVSYQEMFQQAGRRDPVRAGLISDYASKLATIITKSEKPTELWLALEYSFREMIRNAFEHSGSDRVWIAAQSWHGDERVQLAIVDEGRGIRDSFAKVRPDLNDAAALRHALAPGISSKSGRKRSPEAEEKLMEEFPDTDPRAYDNSGYGLTFTYELAKRAGSFGIASGTAWFADGDNGRFTNPTVHRGTAIQININLSKVESAMQEWRALTSAQPTHAASRLLTASMMTKLGLDRLKPTLDG